MEDYVPRYQILMLDDSKIYGPCLQWQEPSTIWGRHTGDGIHGRGRFLMIYPSISFKDFNPMWTYPTTAVYQCWDALTFGMPPWHIAPNNEHTARLAKGRFTESITNSSIQVYQYVASVGHCPIARLFFQAETSKGAEKKRTYCPTTWSHCYTWEYAAQYADQLRQAKASPLLCKEDDASSSYSIEQQEPVSCSMCVCRLRKHSYVRSYDQFDSMHRPKDLQGL